MKTTKKTNLLVVIAGIAGLTGASASAQNLINRYSFNETSGIGVSDSVRGLNGTLQGSASFNGSGQAILTGTSGTYINLDPAALSGLTAVTFDGWFSYTVPNNNVHLFSIDNGSGTGGSYLRFNIYDTGNGNGSTNYLETGDPTWIKLRGNQVLPQNQELHISVVYDPVNSYAAIYYNGTLENSYSGTLPALSSIAQTKFTLGQSPWVAYGDPGLVGSINEFRVYDGALSSSQIMANDLLGPNAVPEPGTGAMLATGLGLLLAGFRKRQRQ